MYLAMKTLRTKPEKIFGLVKKTWRDFEVVEESPDRRRACVVDNGIPCLPQSEGRDEPPADREGSSCGLDSVDSETPRADEPGDNPWAAGDTAQCFGLLQQVVPDAVCQSIACFSARLNDDRTASLTVEIRGDKQKRRSFHKCVRALFPHLASRTKRGLEAGTASVQLFIDKQFVDLCEVMPAREAKRLLWYFHCGEAKQSLDLNVISDRGLRRRLHHTLHTLFGQTLEAKTFQGLPRKAHFPVFPEVFADEGGNARLRFVEGHSSECSPKQIERHLSDSKRPSFVQVRFRQRKGSKRQFSEASAPAAQTSYLHFVLEKHNLEITDALHLVANAVGAQLHDFSYAGIKDRRALTRQFVAACGVHPEKLLEAREPLSHKGISLGSFQWQLKPLRLGQLHANHFSLWLRGARCCDSDLMVALRSAAASVVEQGFVNYFGPQRFGLGLTGLSHQVGLAILQGNADAAVNQLLAPSSGGRGGRLNQNDEAREHFARTKDAAASIQLLPPNCFKDQLLLRALKRFGCTEVGYRAALLALPYTSRIFYIHAYTSWLWNAAATYRIELSKGVIVGDLVLQRTDNRKLDSSDKNVKVVTEDDLKVSKYSIFDVVLPLIGRNCVYPQNAVGKMMQQMLADDKLTEKDFKVSWLHCNVPGAARYLIARPDYFEWTTENSPRTLADSCSQGTASVLSHHEQQSPLALSGPDECCVVHATESVSVQSFPARTDLQATELMWTDVHLKFSLGSSCYATSLLHEFTGGGYMLAEHAD